MTNGAGVAPPDPTSTEGIKEADRMRRAKGLSQQIWNATGSLLALLGAAAPFAYGLQATGEEDQSALLLIILAVVVVVLGALCYFLAQSMAETRARRADQVAVANRTGPYLVLGFFITAQVLALPVAALLQGFAVYQTLRGADANSRLELELAERIDRYAVSPEAEYIVDEYCNDHISDNAASKEFLDICVQFNQTPPEKGEAPDLASMLRQAAEDG